MALAANTERVSRDLAFYLKWGGGREEREVEREEEREVEREEGGEEKQGEKERKEEEGK